MSEPVTWAEVKALFTQADRDKMMQISQFDLWDCADVQGWAAAILARVSDPDDPMPPQPWASHNGEEGPWPPERIAIFKAWMDNGMPC